MVLSSDCISVAITVHTVTTRRFKGLISSRAEVPGSVVEGGVRDLPWGSALDVLTRPGPALWRGFGRRDPGRGWQSQYRRPTDRPGWRSGPPVRRTPPGR